MTPPDTGQPDDGDSDEPESRNLSSMTKAQLLEYAEEHGITGVSGDDTKAAIIAAIER